MELTVSPDLSSLYNWNTKQVFVYITAKYPSETPSEPMTEAVIWDAILPSLSEPWHHNQYIHFKPTPSSSSRRAKQKKPSTETPGMLKLKNQKPKYVITDSTGKIAERANATLELNWNVQPWVGALTWTNKRNYGFWKGLKGGITKTFEFPALKKKEGESAGGAKKEDLATEKGAEANKGKPS